MIHPEVQKIYDTYKAIERTLPAHTGDYQSIFMNQITQEVLSLNLPPDPKCQNAAPKGHRATHSGAAGDYCMYCGSRARWFFHGVDY